MQFERRPSQRYARRQSHILKERQRHQPGGDSARSSKATGAEAEANVETEPVIGKDQGKEVDVDLLLSDEPRVIRPRSRGSSPIGNASASLSPPETPTSRSTPSPGAGSGRLLETSATPPPPTPEDPLDSLIKSIAKETGGFLLPDSSATDPDVHVVPNNQTKYVSLPKPLPPDKLKCNIWKAKVEEDLKKPAAEGSISTQLNGYVNHELAIKWSRKIGNMSVKNGCA